MLGIPAGRGGEREERSRSGKEERRDRGDAQRREGRRDRPPREERSEASQAKQATPDGEQRQPKSQDTRQHKARDEHKGRDRGARGRKPEKSPRAQGPLVVVKRATGAIETRPLEADTTAATPKAPEPQPKNGAVPEASATPVAPETPAVSEIAPKRVPTPSAPGAILQEMPEKESFAEMFEAATKRDAKASRRSVRVGEKVAGTIFQLGAEVAFVTLEGISREAMIDMNQLQDEQGILRYGVGDAIEAYVLETGAKGIILSKTLPKGQASMAMLVEARASGIPVEGLVLGINKGGLEVAIGDVRAFCPASQVDTHYVGKLDDLVGERFKFKVTEVRGKNVVLSRRAVLEEEQRALAAETRKTLAEGKVVRGKVTSVRDFGVFVDLGGLEGLIPVSELSHSRVSHPSEVVKVGDELEVEVLKMEPPHPESSDKAKHRERITLSLRARQEDPWKVAASELKEGDRLEGKVVRLQPFGAFVELRPGVDGLIHVSALSDRRIAHPRDVVKVGDVVPVVIEKIDTNEKRIGLRRVIEEAALPAEEKAVEQKPAEEKKPAEKKESVPPPRVGQVINGTIDRIEPYGVFVSFPGGKGLIPASETGTDRGTDLKRHFKLGDTLQAAIIEIDASKKIRLSVTGAEKAEERASLEEWKKTQSKPGGKGFGTFADLLKGKKLL
jgi:small subunit ribosomal protein S1